jgi:flagellar P-ring protein precursor FlgI
MNRHERQAKHWFTGLHRRSSVFIGGYLFLCLCLSQSAQAVQVQDIARLKGSEQSKIVGMGLVVGLRGTGDGGKFLPAMRPLAEVIGTLIDPNVVAVELKDAKNVALVTITATLSASGVREGDRIDCHIASLGPAKSLEGGRLFLIPLKAPRRDDPRIFAFAEGAVTIEDPNIPTVGVIKDGAQLTRDVMSQYLDEYGRLTLVLEESSASWPVANNLANLINGVMAPDGPQLAKAIDQKNIIVDVPLYERASPAAFISQILQSYIDPTQIAVGSRVLINERTKTIIVSGDVQISPVVISHKGLTITTITPEPTPAPNAPKIERSGWVGIDPEKRGGAKLTDLIEALKKLEVAPEDRITLVKELHASGFLHAQLLVE